MAIWGRMICFLPLPVYKKDNNLDTLCPFIKTGAIRNIHPFAVTAYPALRVAR